jgi:nucleoside-diphosphate-sugar epimerase
LSLDKLIWSAKVLLNDVAGVEKAFHRDDGKQYDFVFNLAAETKYGQADEVTSSNKVYDEKVYQLSVMVGKETAKRNIKLFLEASTAQIYDAGKKPSTEDGKMKPWTHIAKAKLKAEEELQKIPGLKLVIVRPSIVYGPADILGITPRLIIGAVYRHLKEEMKLLWTKDLKINTVHVADVCKALWFVSAKKEDKGGRTTDLTATEIYNICDKGDTGICNLSDQGTVNNFIETIFGIETGFQGTMISQFAKVLLSDYSSIWILSPRMSMTSIFSLGVIYAKPGIFKIRH